MRNFLLAIILLSACTDKAEPEPVVINEAPVANAGNDQIISADDGAILDGGGSYDPDGDALTYHWEFDSTPSGSTVDSMENPFPGNHGSFPSTTFNPDLAGTYVIGLTVTDPGGLSSDEDFVLVTVEKGGLPLAIAGEDMNGTAGDSFTLDGSASYDPLGRTLSYAWTMSSTPGGSGVTGFDDATSAAPSFVSDVGGTYVASLIVNNGISSSAPDTTVIRVKGISPQPPVADAGEDILDAYDCTIISLDGTASYDPNDDLLTYLWSVQQKPSGSVVTDASFSDRTGATTEFWADIAGDYELSLVVNDGSAWSTPDLILVTATERTENTAPEISAGSPKSLAAGDATCIESGYVYACDDCESLTADLGDDATAVDADLDPLLYEWTVLSGSAAIADPTALITTVELTGAAPTEPTACEDNLYEFQLTATDCTGASTTSTVNYTVTCCGLIEESK